MNFLDIKNIAFEVLAYPVSYVELVGTSFGLASVYFASRANILTWATGIVNEIFLFILFFQVQLYADMFLQIYFFVLTVYGWYRWGKKTSENTISIVDRRHRLFLAISIFAGTLIAGFFFADLHRVLPTYFKVQAAYPYSDSFIMVMSIVATILLAKKKIENWYLWITVDLVAVILYFKKGIYFLSIEYLIFLGLASYGLFHWREKLKND